MEYFVDNVFSEELKLRKFALGEYLALAPVDLDERSHVS